MHTDPRPARLLGARLVLLAFGVTIGVSATVAVRMGHDIGVRVELSVSGDARAADAETPEAICDCGPEAAAAQSRVVAAQSLVETLQAKTPGLVLRDADGNEIGKVIGASASGSSVTFHTYNVTLGATFKVSPLGAIQGIDSVRFSTDDCTGTPYSLGGLSVDAFGNFYKHAAGTPKVSVHWKSVSKPFADPPCETITSSTPYDCFELQKLEQAFPAPIKLPFQVVGG